MSFHRETGKQVLPDHLSSAAVIATTGAFILLIALLWKPGKHHRLVVFAPISVALSARVWSLIVSHFVPEPYLVRLTEQHRMQISMAYKGAG
jgi:hypothetical protein